MPQTHLPPVSLPRKLYYLLLLYFCKITWSLAFTILPPFLPHLFPPPTSKKSYPCLPRHPVYFYLPTTPPPAGKKYTLYISIHGGSFTYGTPKKDSRWCHALTSKLSCITASLSYRKSPRHTFPAILSDCSNLISAILSDPDYSPIIDFSNVVIGGFSAGGLLALSLVQLPQWAGKFKAVVSWYPKVDGTLTWAEQCSGVDAVDPKLRFFVPAIFWGAGRGVRLDDPLYSPAFMDMSLVPERLLVCAGREDIFCRESEGFVGRIVRERYGGVSEGEGGRVVAGGGKVVGWWVEGMGHTFTHKLPTGKTEAEKRLHKEKVDVVLDGVMGWIGDVFDGKI